MEQFIVSARKYRPDSFSSMVGQDNITTTLKNSITRGQLAHAYLFCGPRGVGKTTAARIFAKSINCLNASENMEPCGECESCISFAKGSSYCIHELDAASNNSVDDIRNLNELVRIPPQIGQYSVYIIDEVHMLSSSAFNAFLKTLEEPPAHAVFILATTEKHKILPTILSRCQTYDFNRISIENIVLNLKDIAQKEDITIEDDALHIIAQKADGAMRDALTLFDQTIAFSGRDIKYADVIKNLNVLDYDYYFKIIDMSIAGDFAPSLIMFDELLSKGFNALHFISGISSHLRDLLVCKNGATASLLSVPPSVVKKYQEQSNKVSVKFIFEALKITTECEAGYKQSGNQRLLIEFSLLKLASINKAASQIEAAPATTTTPATTTAPEAAPATLPKAQANTSAPSVSLKTILEQAQQNISTPKVQTQKQDNTFTYADLEKSWEAMAQDERTNNRASLASAIMLKKPELKEDNHTVIFYVSNSAQKSWIEKVCLIRLNAFLCNHLQNSKIRLLVEITTSTEDNDAAPVPHMPTEKAKVLLSQNEELKKLSNELQLDVK